MVSLATDKGDDLQVLELSLCRRAAIEQPGA